jgi:SNF2 family DNA or RNA helicase
MGEVFPFYTYQIEDVNMMFAALTQGRYYGTSNNHPLHCYLNCSEMGTGKTAVTWGVLDKLRKAKLLNGPVLIVVPNQCSHVWTDNELYRDTFLHHFRVESVLSAESQSEKKHLVVRITYGKLRSLYKSKDALFSTMFSVVVFDEVHALKSNSSKTSIAANALKRCYSIGLSGTPVMNGGIELFSIMRNALHLDNANYTLLKQHPKSNYALRLISSFSHGRKKANVASSETAAVCVDTREGIAWTNAQTKREYVRNKEITLGRCIPGNQQRREESSHVLACIQRLRASCLFPAPETIPWTMYAESVDSIVYTVLLCIRRHYGAAYGNLNVRLALIAAIAPTVRASDKMQRSLQLIQETSGKVVVVSAFRRFLEEYMTVFCARHGIGTCLFTGGNKNAQQKSLHRFRNDPAIKVMLMVKQAGALGLNLQHSANTCILMDPHYNRALDDQAAHRVNRIGQQSNVRIYRLFMRGSIEELMLIMQAQKEKEVGAWFNPASDKTAMFQQCGLFLRERDQVKI